MKYVCPSCERPIYNRRINKCEFCEKVLPNDLLLSQSEIEDLDKQHGESMKKKTNTSGNSSGNEFLSTGFGGFSGGD